MDGSRGYGGCHDMISLLENTNRSLWLPASSSSFNETMVNFDQAPQQLQQQGLRPNPKRDRYDGLLARTSDGEDTGGDDSDANLNHNSEKKRRLTSEQVQFLEKSFESENKLEPERKVHLAKQVGLQPRQVAIWFQNRRARYKNKQIEKEFETLKDSYNRLKVDYDSINRENEKLKNEVEMYKKLAQREGKEINLNPNNIMTNMNSHGKMYKTESGGLVSQGTKLAEDASSAKSDIFDYESPHCIDGNQSSALVETCSTLIRGPHQQSDFSQEEHMMMTKSLLLPQTPPTFNNFLKVADDENYDPNANSCNFSLVDDQPFWSF